MIVGVIGLTLMYVGNGKALTFAGIGLFLLFMWQITRISLAAIELQAARFRETRADIRSDDDDTVESSTIVETDLPQAGD